MLNTEALSFAFSLSLPEPEAGAGLEPAAMEY